jgi:hypothetical protein
MCTSQRRAGGCTSQRCAGGCVRAAQAAVLVPPASPARPGLNRFRSLGSVRVPRDSPGPVPARCHPSLMIWPAACTQCIACERHGRLSEYDDGPHPHQRYTPPQAAEDGGGGRPVGDGWTVKAGAQDGLLAPRRDRPSESSGTRQGSAQPRSAAGPHSLLPNPTTFQHWPQLTNRFCSMPWRTLKT